MIEKIKSYFFGEKRQIQVSDLGIFEARVKSNSKTSWMNTNAIKLDFGMINFLLMGDDSGPYKSEVRNAQEILNRIKQLREQVKSYPGVQSKYGALDSSKLREIQVNSWDEDDGIFEITFTYQTSKSILLGAMYKDGKVYDIE